MNPVFFKSSSELRRWLSWNYDKAEDQWIALYKVGSGKPSITYAEAVDQALCFGWIEGIRKSVDETAYTSRFAPRKPRSVWRLVNIRRASELVELGLMQPAGLKAFEARDEARSGQYSCETWRPGFDTAFERQFRRHRKAWEFFQAQPRGYRRTASYWVMSAKRGRHPPSPAGGGDRGLGERAEARGGGVAREGEVKRRRLWGSKLYSLCGI